MRLLAPAADRVLTLGAVLGGLALVALLGGFAAGVRPVFLTSGSMAPTMPTGSLLLVRAVPAADLVVGDVVCVESAPGVRVTHRIAAIDRVGGVAHLTLRGDANQAVDAQVYPVTSAQKVVAHVPAAGYVVGWASTPWGYVVLGAAGTVLLALVVRGDRRPPAGKRRARRGAAGVLAALVGLAVLGPGAVLPAGAAPWTDAVSIGGTSLTAASVPAPATFTCGTLGVLSVRFNWTAVPGATDYTVHYGIGGASTTTITGTTALLTAAVSGGTAWVVANTAYGSTTWTSAASPSRSYTVAVVSLCA